MRRFTTRRLAIATAVVVAAAAIGGGVAIAAGGDDDATDTPITGAALQKASAAALAHTGGGEGHRHGGRRRGEPLRGRGDARRRLTGGRPARRAVRRRRLRGGARRAGRLTPATRSASDLVTVCCFVAFGSGNGRGASSGLAEQRRNPFESDLVTDCCFVTLDAGRERLCSHCVWSHRRGSTGSCSRRSTCPCRNPGEALVRVHAAALTRDELEWPVDRLPATPSYELSGVVEAVGPDVDGVTAGDEVFALTPFDRDGAAAEYAVVPAAALAPKPQDARPPRRPRPCRSPR